MNTTHDENMQSMETQTVWSAGHSPYRMEQTTKRNIAPRTGGLVDADGRSGTPEAATDARTLQPDQHQYKTKGYTTPGSKSNKDV